ncbi:342_t:CDS:2 [Gigaspora margarita]|uniref:342_t:CDS:1 n=1 Tax=Gigaspora margarita TaxID=4874 RepID=A0ABM8VWZ7_GIGMA|nr:342_t:CDS:2 [Gigaspora margarita]
MEQKKKVKSRKDINADYRRNKKVKEEAHLKQLEATIENLRKELESTKCKAFYFVGQIKEKEKEISELRKENRLLLEKLYSGNGPMLNNINPVNIANNSNIDENNEQAQVASMPSSQLYQDNGFLEIGSTDFTFIHPNEDYELEFITALAGQPGRR